MVLILCSCYVFECLYCNKLIHYVLLVDNNETMCDQVINEHFRRSLGKDYVNVFSSNKKNDNQIPSSQPSSNAVENHTIKERTSNGRVSPSPLSGELLILNLQKLASLTGSS